MNEPTRENQVEVDPEQLAREADAIEVQDTTEPANSGTEPAAKVGTGGDGAAAVSPPASWSPISPGVVQLVDLFVCPAWKLTPAEKDALAEALTPALDQAFPGGLGDERWAPYARLALVVVGIALSRFDRATGRLEPLRAAKLAQANGGADGAAAPSASPFAVPVEPGQ